MPAEIRAWLAHPGSTKEKAEVAVALPPFARSLDFADGLFRGSDFGLTACHFVTDR